MTAPESSEPSPELSEELVAITTLVPGGRGMAVLRDGRRAFVRGAYPGDLGYLRGVKLKTSYVEADAFLLERPSPHRVAAPCPVFSSCGGCDLMALSKVAQLDGKRAILKDAFTRIGKFGPEEFSQEILITPSPNEFGYRSRIRLKVSEGKVGFLAAGSHELVEVESCLVAKKEVGEALTRVREVMKSDPSAFEQVDHIEIRSLGEEAPPTGRSLHVVLRRSEKGRPLHPSPALRARLAELSTQMRVRIGAEKTAPDSYEPALGVRVPAPLGGFTQVNEAVNRLLVSKVCALAREHGARTFLDVYCGSGNFSLPLAAQGLNGVGVERNAEAIHEAERASKGMKNQSGLGQVEFVSEESRDCLARLLREGRRFDVLIVDPPRAGAKDLVPLILKLAPPLLLLVSCDPTTLARDLRGLVEGGYGLQSLEGFDMFPQTHHVESLAVLRHL